MKLTLTDEECDELWGESDPTSTTGFHNTGSILRVFARAAFALGDKRRRKRDVEIVGGHLTDVTCFGDISKECINRICDAIEADREAKDAAE